MRLAVSPMAAPADNTRSAAVTLTAVSRKVSRMLPAVAKTATVPSNWSPVLSAPRVMLPVPAW